MRTPWGWVGPAARGRLSRRTTPEEIATEPLPAPYRTLPARGTKGDRERFAVYQLGIPLSIHIGTADAESIRVMGDVPSDCRGLIVRGMVVYLEVAQAPHPNDYWIIELGTVFGGGDFEVRAIMAQPKVGFQKGANAMDLRPKVRYSVSENVAVRVRPYGSPEALTGCDVALKAQEP